MQRLTFLHRTIATATVFTMIQLASTFTVPSVHNKYAISTTTNHNSNRQYQYQQYYITSSTSTRRQMHFHDNANTLWTAVEFFDGNTIVDPVVVSNVFWSRLQANIISVLIGQLLAAIVFSILLSVASSQISKVLNYISEQIFSSTTTGTGNIRIPKDLRDDTQSDVQFIRPDFGKLVVCLAIDAIGSSSILIPFIGDATDFVWAPTAGLLLRYLFNNSNVLFILEFTEEILPLTDILPLATLCWIVETYFSTSNLAKLLQLGEYSSVTTRDRLDAIDIDVRDGISKSSDKK